MAQFHHVVYYDTADEQWHIDMQTDAYLPDGEVFDYARSGEWEGVPEAEENNYHEQMLYIIENLNAFTYNPEPLD